MEEERAGQFRTEKVEVSFSLDRRQFLKLIGSGIIVFFSTGDLAESQQRPSRPAQELPKDFNAFLRIGEDGRVTCFTGKIEMGQGIITSLAQMLGEELDVPLNRIDMIMGDTDLCPWDMGTFGSRSTKYFGPVLREAAAEARKILIEVASDFLKIPVGRLIVKEGMVIDRSHPDKKASYGQLAIGKRIEKQLDQKPSVKPISAFTLSGKPVGRTDALDKVTGKASYAGDIRLPGMLYARILRPPAHGARVRSVDVTAAEKISGVQVIREGDFIAVLHAQFDGAEKALSLIKANFDEPENKVDDQTIFDHLLRVAPRGDVIEQKGDMERGRGLAALVLEGIYLNRYLAHAPMETHTAMANVEGGKVTVWASTQRPFGAKEEVAQVLGISPKDVRVITPFVGGGFGGKSRNRQVVEAARLAKAVGKPVQVAWSREEEFFYDTFQPSAIVKIKSGLDHSKRIVFWDYEVFFAGERSSQCFYDVPHFRTLSHGSWSGGGNGHPFEVGAWRAPGSNTNTFARESHIDVMASRADMDPVEFRLAHLKDKRMQKVLEVVAKIFGWSSAKALGNRGCGVACAIYLGTYLATMAEVDVNQETGHIQVKRVACAQDMGQIINPEGAKMQMEGCMMMGLGYALTEEIHFKGGEIQDLNFDTYEIPRFSWLPKLEAVLVENPDVPPQGGGEPAIICMGAVIANAVFDATGIRFFELPMTPERVKKAMAEARNKKS